MTSSKVKADVLLVAIYLPEVSIFQVST